jgi:hypothetical protein
MHAAFSLAAVLLLGAAVAAVQGGWGGRDASLEAPAPRDAAPAIEPLTLRSVSVAVAPAPTEAAVAPGASPEALAGDAEAEEVIEECGVGAPDPVETGTCSLVVNLKDEAGAAPRLVDLELWRLGAPGNEHWLPGDQRQAQATTQEGRVQWDGLPAGTYRLFSGDLRPGADDPPAFHVDGALTVVDATLAMPRQVPVQVRVVDERGAALTEGKLELGGMSSYDHDVEPAWRRERKSRSGDALQEFSFTTSCGCGRSRADDRPVTQGAEGFELGTCNESSRAGDESWSADLTFPGRTSVSAYVKTKDVHHPHALRLVAVSVPLEPIVASLRLPDGTYARDAGARVVARSRAVVVPKEGPPPDPSTLPIHVTVRLFEHEPLEFEVRAGERLPDRTLVRSASKAELAR